MKAAPNSNFKWEVFMAGQMVEFPSNGGTATGYLAIPESGHGPGVIVIQEWWGLVPHIKSVCDRFAAEGYVALAPDLYHGKSTTSPDEAGKLMMAMRIDEAEKDLRGAIQYLLKHDAVTGDKIGTVGFCMGGALSLYAATRNPQVGACVIFYGGHPSVKPDLENLQAPVLGLYAERDSFVTPESVRELERRLKALGKSVEMHIYPGVDHGFFNDERAVYDEAAAKDAWQRVLKFFGEHLK
jgi:carboxymethylenebutenolidase